MIGASRELSVMPLRFKQAISILALGALGWALCGTVMFAGMK